MTAADHGYEFYSVSMMEALIAKMCAGSVFYIVEGLKLIGMFVTGISTSDSSGASGEPSATARHVDANIRSDKTAEAKTGGLSSILKEGERDMS
ncbi:hypothetical protein HYH03_000809 [Edaphochlamys debaryana]|uniref:Uncharacterized protein n=1 Tax=Edaphochlamys debaryana TaxID=47281 RepID=A0A835YDL6_9CHLO|nr:hypothetical protein HYH03_000809 [Edaphochlamys debaryana]|eukprot:KAG2500987.1 hypothetical protein HYH03_000809 [Edaphochlamys debaryana]